MRVESLARYCASIALWSLASGVSAQDPPINPRWAQDFLQRWYASYNGGDAAAVANLFTANGKLGRDERREAIEAGLKRAFSTTSYRCSGRFEALREICDLAVAWGIDTCTETPKPNGSPVTTKERWLIVLERQADGKWLISRETWEDIIP